MSPSTAGRARIRIPEQANPFGSAALGSPWSAFQADVPSINDRAFREIMAGLGQVRMGAKGSSIVVTGEPGSGKTHLLGRLRTALPADTAFIYIRCNASASTLWRHVRTAMATDLLKKNGGVSRLHLAWRNHPDSLDSVPSLTLRRVLESYVEGRNVAAASAWLRGETLPESDLAALNIAIDKDDEEQSREADAREAVDGILKFLAPDAAVICFDQVEALETYRGDTEGFHAMGTLMAHLVDAHEHLLLVSCIVSAFEDRFEQLANQANRARWLQKQVTLKPVSWDEAVQLIRIRLDSSAALAALRRENSQDPLWPLDGAVLRPLFERTGLCLPRALIERCKTHFESLFGQDVPARPKLNRGDFLAAEYAKNFAEAEVNVLNQGADKTLLESLPWLMENNGYEPVERRGERPAGANLFFRGPGGEFGVVFCSAGGLQTTNRLKKVVSVWDPLRIGLRVVRDPSRRHGSKADEILAYLKRLGAREVHAVPEAVAALQAIHDMVASARSGDLAQDGEAIPESEVTAWARWNMPNSVTRIINGMKGADAAEEVADERPGAAVPSALDQLLLELVAKRKILEAEMAARELCVNVEEVSAVARRNSIRIGLLAGPPPVLFERIIYEGGGNPAGRSAFIRA
jgi:hypothetical protein